MNDLTRLADRHGTDKGSRGRDPHHYTLLYDMLLSGRRRDLRHMIEIGLLRGGPEVGIDKDRPTGDLPSVRMWLDYLPEAVVHGFDISDFSFFRHPRFRFTRGDAGDAADLQRLAAGAERFEFVIDDGSHASFHQQQALLALWPRLAPGGLYVVEDLHWQSPAYEDALPPADKTRDLVAHWLRSRRFPDPRTDVLAGLPALADEVDYALLVDQPFVADRLAKVAVLRKRC